LRVKAPTFTRTWESVDQSVADGGIVNKYLHPDTEKASCLRQTHQGLNHHSIAWTQGKKLVPRIFRHQPCFQALLDAVERDQSSVGVGCGGTWALKSHKSEGGKSKFLLRATEPRGNLHATTSIVEISKKVLSRSGSRTSLSTTSLSSLVELQFTQASRKFSHLPIKA
jgi:hypothetical protein